MSPLTTKQPKNGKRVKLAQKMWLTADKDTVVEDGDPASAFLLGTEGDEIDAQEADRLGLSIDGVVASLGGKRVRRKTAEKVEKRGGGKKQADDPADDLSDDEREVLKDLSPEELGALTDLSDEDRDALAGLSDEDRDAVAALAGGGS